MGAGFSVGVSLTELVLYLFSKSSTTFYTAITNKGLQLYFRGKQAGIVGTKRKYRLKNLGFSLERIYALDLTKNKRQQELERIITSRTQELDTNREEQEL